MYYSRSTMTFIFIIVFKWNEPYLHVVSFFFQSLKDFLVLWDAKWPLVKKLYRLCSCPVLNNCATIIFLHGPKKSHRVLFHHFVTCYDQRLQQKPSMVRALQPASLPFRQIVLWGDPEMKESLFTATLPSQASCQVLRNLYLTCIFEYLGTLTSPCMYIQGVRTSWGH